MMISTRGRYALRVMIDLAEHSEGFIPMKAVAQRQGISLKYLEQILPVLTKHHLIEGIQGRGGGYRLCRKPEDYTAGEILRLIAGGARWRDISVACTAPERLLPALQRVFDKAQIPLYISGDQGVLRHGAMRMLLSALQAACGEMEQESVLAYLKSGFLPLTREACDRLEDYIFLWNIDGNLFSKQWQMHPDGLEHSTDATQRLATLNEDRLRSIGPLLRLRTRLRSAENTGQMVTALYEFTEQIGLEQKMSALAQACAQDGRLQEAQEYVQLYALVCDLLEQMYGVLGATEGHEGEGGLFLRHWADIIAKVTSSRGGDRITFPIRANAGRARRARARR